MLRANISKAKPGQWWLLSLIFLIVSACATTAQIEAINLAKKGRTALDVDNACREPLELNPRYGRINEKFGVAKSNDPNRMPSQAQMTDNTKISDDDIALGLNWYAEIQRCDLPAIASLGEIAPEFQTVFVHSQSEIADILNEIVSTKPTFARINQRIYALKLQNAQNPSQIL
jgi:hypothetical protein